MRTLIALVRTGRPPWKRVALSIVLGSLTVLLGVGLMGVAGYLISRAAERPPILSLTVAIVAVRAFGIGRPVARYFERLTSHDLAFRVLTGMRVGFYRALEPRTPAPGATYRQGDLLARMTGDVDATQALFQRGISPPLVALVVSVVSVWVMATFLPAAAIVLAVGLAVGGILVPAAAWRLGGMRAKREVELRAALTAELVELLRAAPELVVLGADADRMARVKDLDARLQRLARRDAIVGGLVEGLQLFVAGLTLVGVLAVCVQAAAEGALDRVLIAALALGTMASFEAVAPLPSVALGLRSTIEAGGRLLDVTEHVPPVQDPDVPGALGSDHGVRLEGVSFDHDNDDTWGLRDLDLSLPPGARVALVGHSGSGKSTVASLMVRFFDPDAGRVTIGGNDAKTIRQRDLRATVSLDDQDAYLFATSIRENVRLAKPGAPDSEIEAALRRARAWDWIASLGDGLDTFVGEDGTHVSGGERRRIALARSFLADAPVLVLDEPTAHLDRDTASALVQDILSGFDHRSVLLITHGTEGLDAVDEVVTLRRGRVAAADRMDALSEEDGQP